MPKFIQAQKKYKGETFLSEIDASILLDLSKLYWFDNSSKLIAMTKLNLDKKETLTHYKITYF